MRDIILRQKFERDRLVKGSYVEREKLAHARKWLYSDLIKVITGPRRAGKSVFAFMLLKDIPFMYFNFDEILPQHFSTDEFLKHLHGVYGDIKTVLFDEIQNLPSWELLVNRLHREGYNVVITGSNAKLLSKELASVLTGRHIPIEILPFSFKEFLKAKNMEIENEYMNLPSKRGEILKLLEEYTFNGGFPEIVVKNFDPLEYLRILFDSIVFKDIVRRYNVRHPHQLTILSEYLIDNFARLFTFRRLKDILNLRSVTTIEKYLEYFEEAYLFIYLERFSFKSSMKVKSPRKIYVIDNGYIMAKSVRISPEYGKLMENMVIVELLKRGFVPNWNIFYYTTKTGKEIDFLVKEGNEIMELIQVTYTAKNPETLKREVRSLSEASKELSAKNLTILTWDEEGDIPIEDNVIKIIPLWKWLLNY